MKFLPPHFLFLFTLLAIILHFTIPLKQIIYVPYNLLGIILIILGLIPAFWTKNHFEKKNTTILPHENPTSLSLEGPFRISRNPIYLGAVLTLFGVAILLGSIITFIFPLFMFFVLDFLFIPFEEENLERIFKNKYLDYKNKVRRWI